MLTIRHQGAAMAAGQLLLASVAIVHRDDHAVAHRCGQARHVAMREQRNFDAFSRLGMHAVAVEKFQFFGRGRDPGFDEAVALEWRYAKGSLWR